VRTLVIQSYDETSVKPWLLQCRASVQAWAQACRFDYRFIGDEALLLTPQWYRDKLGDRLPIVADLARLLLIKQALDSGYEQACWLDADVFVFAPDRLHLHYQQTCAFGREYWVSADSRGRLSVRRNVHNAVCVFKVGCPVLPFLIHATEQIIRRVDPDNIAPQMVGPKLLGALHSLAGFDLIESVGAFSPAIVGELQTVHPGQPTPGPAVERLLDATPIRLAGANLCASLNGDRDLDALCEQLRSGIFHALDGTMPGKQRSGRHDD
jgi:hypothetical protein